VIDDEHHIDESRVRGACQPAYDRHDDCTTRWE
jgi:hypothetical protein